MLTATTHAAPDIGLVRTRALSAIAGAAAAAIGWAIEVPMLGVRLDIRFGAMHPQVIAPGQIIGAALAAGLAGWLALAVLDRRARHPRTAWTVTAVAVLAVSLALPLVAATTTAAAAGLEVLHLAVGASVIPAMARTARAR
ncbi:MAG TPA: DUF6069 family protein [Streptosporangiaceae bacterium]|nr:DUF6069 family protein [Streptosporangiaceae bacterium]